MQLQIPALHEDGTLAQPPVPIQALAERLRGQPIAPQPLKQQTLRGRRMWRLVLPREARSGPSPDDVGKALEPLLRHRGGMTPLYYAPSPELSPEANAKAFEETHADLLYKHPVSLLLAGSLEDLPWALQTLLGRVYPTGRLSFPRLEDYAQYAERVVDAEQASHTERCSDVLLFAPRSSKDDATIITHDALVAPLRQTLVARRRGLKSASCLADQALGPNLLEHLEKLPARGLWVSGGHGCEPRGWTTQQLGALFDQQDVLVHEGNVAGLSRCVHQGIAVLIACFGAGRRADADHARILGKVEPEQAPDLLAPLPTAMLTHAQGPLAVLAHVNWIHLLSFGDRVLTLPWDGEQPGVQPLQGVLSALVQGEQLGLALQYMRDQHLRRRSELSELLLAQQWTSTQATEAEDALLVHTWLASIDAQSWVVMGDPAARLAGGKR